MLKNSLRQLLEISLMISPLIIFIFLLKKYSAPTWSNRPAAAVGPVNHPADRSDFLANAAQSLSAGCG